MIMHHFITCSEIPNDITYSEFNREHLIKINDQFIREYYEIFRKVKLCWNDLYTIGEGFNYYGITIINPKMANELIIAINQYLENNASEAAEYFRGDELDNLISLLENTVKNNCYLIHFGN